MPYVVEQILYEASAIFESLEVEYPETELDVDYRLGNTLELRANTDEQTLEAKKILGHVREKREAQDNRSQVPAEQPYAAEDEELDSTLTYYDEAVISQRSGDLPKALKLLEKCLNLRYPKFGLFASANVNVMLTYSDFLRDAARYDEAESILQSALKSAINGRSRINLKAAEVLNSLGNLQRIRTTFDAAEESLQEALKIRREVLGDEHIQVAATLNNLAELKRERGDNIGALEFHTKAITLFESVAGLTHPGTVNAKGSYGITLQRLARMSEAAGADYVAQAMDYMYAQGYEGQHPWLVKFSSESMLKEARTHAAAHHFELSVERYDSVLSRKLRNQASVASLPEVEQLHVREIERERFEVLLQWTTVSLSRCKFTTAMEVSARCEGFLQQYVSIGTQVMHEVLWLAQHMLSQAQLCAFAGRYHEASQVASKARVILENQERNQEGGVQNHNLVHITVLQFLARLHIDYANYVEARLVLDKVQRLLKQRVGQDSGTFGKAPLGTTLSLLQTQVLEGRYLFAVGDFEGLKGQLSLMEQLVAGHALFDHALYAEVLLLSSQLECVHGSHLLVTEHLQSAQQLVASHLGKVHVLYVDTLLQQAEAESFQGRFLEAMQAVDESELSLQSMLLPLSSYCLPNSSGMSTSAGASTSKAGFKSNKAPVSPSPLHHPLLCQMQLVRAKVLHAADRLREARVCCEELISGRLNLLLNAISLLSPSEAPGSTATIDAAALLSAAVAAKNNGSVSASVSISTVGVKAPSVSHPIIAQTQEALGNIFVDLFDFTRAKDLHLQAYATWLLCFPDQSNDGSSSDGPRNIYMKARCRYLRCAAQVQHLRPTPLVLNSLEEARKDIESVLVRLRSDGSCLLLAQVLALKGRILYYQADYAQARDITGAAGAMMRAYLHTRHESPTLYAILMQQSQILTALGQFRDAKVLLSYAFAQLQILLGPLYALHHLILEALYLSAENMRLVGFFFDAIDALDLLESYVARRFGTTSPDMTRVLYQQALLHRDMRRFAKAEDAFLQAEARIRTTYGVASYLYLDWKWQFARGLITHSKHSRAYTLLNEVSTEMEGLLGSSKVLEALLLSDLCMIQLIAKPNEQQKALQQLKEEVYPALLKVFGSASLSVLQARGRMALFMNSLKKDSGRKLLFEVLKLLDENKPYALPFDHPIVLELGGYEKASSKDRVSKNIQEDALFLWAFIDLTQDNSNTSNNIDSQKQWLPKSIFVDVENHAADKWGSVHYYGLDLNGTSSNNATNNNSVTAYSNVVGPNGRKSTPFVTGRAQNASNGFHTEESDDNQNGAPGSKKAVRAQSSGAVQALVLENESLEDALLREHKAKRALEDEQVLLKHELRNVEEALEGERLESKRLNKVVEEQQTLVDKQQMQITVMASDMQALKEQLQAVQEALQVKIDAEKAAEEARLEAEAIAAAEAQRLADELAYQAAHPELLQPEDDPVHRVDLEAASFLFKRAQNLYERGFYRKAQPFFDECSQMRERILTLYKPLCLETLRAQAMNLLQLAHFSAADALFVRIYDHVAVQRGVEAEFTLTIALDIAHSQLCQGVYSEVNRWLEPVAKVLALRSQNAASEENQPSNAAGSGGDPASAETIKKEKELQQRSLNALYGRCLTLQSTYSLHLGKIHESKALIERAQALLSRALGINTLDNVQSMLVKTELLLCLGKDKEAVSLVEQAQTIVKALVKASEEVATDLHDHNASQRGNTHHDATGSKTAAGADINDSEKGTPKPAVVDYEHPILATCTLLQARALMGMCKYFEARKRLHLARSQYQRFLPLPAHNGSSKDEDEEVDMVDARLFPIALYEARFSFEVCDFIEAERIVQRMLKALTRTNAVYEVVVSTYSNVATDVNETTVASNDSTSNDNLAKDKKQLTKAAPASPTQTDAQPSTTVTAPAVTVVPTPYIEGQALLLLAQVTLRSGHFLKTSEAIRQVSLWSSTSLSLLANSLVCLEAKVVYIHSQLLLGKYLDVQALLEDVLEGIRTVVGKEHVLAIYTQLLYGDHFYLSSSPSASTEDKAENHPGKEEAEKHYMRALKSIKVMCPEGHWLCIEALRRLIVQALQQRAVDLARQYIAEMSTANNGLFGAFVQHEYYPLILAFESQSMLLEVVLRGPEEGVQSNAVVVIEGGGTSGENNGKNGVEEEKKENPDPTATTVDDAELPVDAEQKESKDGESDDGDNEVSVLDRDADEDMQESKILASLPVFDAERFQVIRDRLDSALQRFEALYASTRLRKSSPSFSSKQHGGKDDTSATLVESAQAVYALEESQDKEVQWQTGAPYVAYLRGLQGQLQLLEYVALQTYIRGLSQAQREVYYNQQAVQQASKQHHKPQQPNNRILDATQAKAPEPEGKRLMQQALSVLRSYWGLVDSHPYIAELSDTLRTLELQFDDMEIANFQYQRARVLKGRGMFFEAHALFEESFALFFSCLGPAQSAQSLVLSELLFEIAETARHLAQPVDLITSLHLLSVRMYRMYHGEVTDVFVLKNLVCMTQLLLDQHLYDDALTTLRQFEVTFFASIHGAHAAWNGNQNKDSKNDPKNEGKSGRGSIQVDTHNSDDQVKDMNAFRLLVRIKCGIVECLLKTHRYEEARQVSRETLELLQHLSHEDMSSDIIASALINVYCNDVQICDREGLFSRSDEIYVQIDTVFASWASQMTQLSGSGTLSDSTSYGEYTLLRAQALQLRAEHYLALNRFADATTCSKEAMHLRLLLLDRNYNNSLKQTSLLTNKDVNAATATTAGPNNNTISNSNSNSNAKNSRAAREKAEEVHGHFMIALDTLMNACMQSSRTNKQKNLANNIGSADNNAKSVADNAPSATNDHVLRKKKKDGENEEEEQLDEEMHAAMDEVYNGRRDNSNTSQIANASDTSSAQQKEEGNEEVAHFSVLDFEQGSGGTNTRYFSWQGLKLPAHVLVCESLFVEAQLALLLGQVARAKDSLETTQQMLSMLYLKPSLFKLDVLHHAAELKLLQNQIEEAQKLHMTCLEQRLSLVSSRMDTCLEVSSSFAALAKGHILKCQLDDAMQSINDALKIERKCWHYLLASTFAATPSAGVRRPTSSDSQHYRLQALLLVCVEILFQKGLFVDAQGLVQSTLTQLKHLVGDLHLLVAHAHLLQGRIACVMGTYDLAMSAMQQCKSVVLVLVGDGHYLMGIFYYYCAQLLRVTGKVLEAKEQLDLSVIALRNQLGKYHYFTVSTLMEIGINFSDLGKFITAQHVLNRALHLLRKTLGKDHILLAYGYYALAELHLQMGLADDVQGYVEQALYIIRKVIGSDRYPLLAQLMSLTCAVQASKGHFEQAIQGLDDAVALMKLIYDTANHVHIVQGTLLLGHIHLQEGKFHEAKSMYDRAHILLKYAMQNKEHPLSFVAQRGSADVLWTQGRFEQSKALFERCLLGFKDWFGSSHPLIASVLNRLGDVYITLNRFDMAESLLLEAWTIRIRAFHEANSHHPEIASTLVSLSLLLRQKGLIGQTKEEIVAQTQRQKQDKKKQKQRDKMAAYRGHNPSNNKDDASEDTEKKHQKKKKKAPEGNGEAEEEALLLAALDNDLASSKQKKKKQSKKESKVKRMIREVAEGGEVNDGEDRQQVDEGEEGKDGEGGADGEDEEEEEIVIHGNDHDDDEDEGDDEGTVPSVQISAIEKLDAASEADNNGNNNPQNNPVEGGSQSSAPLPPPSNLLDANTLKEDPQRYLAIPLLEAAREHYMAYYNADTAHPLILTVQHHLAECSKLRGQYAQALVIHEDVLVQRRKVLGDLHIDTITSLVALVDVLRITKHVFPTSKGSAGGVYANVAPNNSDMAAIAAAKSSGQVSLVDHLASLTLPLKMPHPGSSTARPKSASHIDDNYIVEDETLKHLQRLRRGHASPQIAQNWRFLSKMIDPNAHPNDPNNKKKALPLPRGYMGYQFPPLKQNEAAQRTSSSSALLDSDNNNNATHNPLHDAKKMCELALQSFRKLFQPEYEAQGLRKKDEHYDHALVAHLLFCKGEIHRLRSDGVLAMKYLEQALAMRRRLFRTHHVVISDCLFAIAELMRMDQRFNQALPIYDKALEIRLETYPHGQHPCVAEIHSALALVAIGQADYVKALEYLQASKNICEKMLGANHPAMALVCNNYAILLQQQGNLKEALVWYRKALQIKQEVFGDTHPETAATMNNIGLLYKAQNRLPLAVSTFEKTLEIQRKVFGQRHPDVAATENNLASIYSQQEGQKFAAKELLKASLTTRMEIFGAEHVVVASTMNNLAVLLFTLGEIGQAKEYFEDALRTRRKLLGDDHPAVAEVLHNLGYWYYTQGYLSEAKHHYEDALRIRQKVAHADKSLEVATTSLHLSGVCDQLGEVQKALVYVQEAYAIRFAVLGELHADTLLVQKSVVYIENRVRARSSTAVGTGSKGGGLGAGLGFDSVVKPQVSVGEEDIFGTP